jgi:hypothetical protein
MADQLEVMRVLRTLPGGKLVVEVSGHQIASISEVGNATIKQRMLAAIGDLIDFAGGYQVLLDAGLVPVLVPPDGEGSMSLEEQQEAFLHSLQGTRPLATTDPGVAAVMADAAPAQAPASGEVNIASRINEIIARMLRSHPRLSERTVELHSDGAGSLLIEVDGRFYDQPSDIEDIDVRLLLKMALKEWERR